MKGIRKVRGITQIVGGAESVGDGGEPRVKSDGRSPERREIGTERRTEMLYSVVCVGVDGGSPVVPGITRPPREKGNGTGLFGCSWSKPKNPKLSPVP